MDYFLHYRRYGTYPDGKPRMRQPVLLLQAFGIWDLYYDRLAAAGREQ